MQYLELCKVQLRELFILGELAFVNFGCLDEWDTYFTEEILNESDALLSVLNFLLLLADDELFENFYLQQEPLFGHSEEIIGLFKEIWA